MLKQMCAALGHGLRRARGVEGEVEGGPDIPLL